MVALLEQIEQTVRLLRQNQGEAMQVVPKLLSVIASRMGAFFSETNLETWQQEAILQRLENLNNAYSNGDIIWLADVLQYEIIDCIGFVIEKTQ